MPTIYSTGLRSPFFRIKTLLKEVDETTRADAGNQTVTASDLIALNRPTDAVKAFTDPSLSMPYEFAILLVQAALHFNIVGVDFETIFNDPIRMSGERSYTNFRKS